MNADTAQMFLKSEDVATSRPSLSVVTPVKARSLWMFVGLGLILAVGIFLRLPPMLFAGPGAPLRSLSAIHPNPGFDGIGYDEALYRGYVDDLTRYGLTSYPYFAERYLIVQTHLPGAILPPTRFVYVYSGYLCHLVFDTDSLASLYLASSIFSILLLLLGCLFAWRLGGAVMGTSVAALMAFAPTQIHMSQHALIDGVFAFWATLSLWLLWENLQRPDRMRWLMAYGVALATMVLTKENALFAYVALLTLLAANRWLRFGVVTRSLLGFTVVGPLAGVVTLVFLCGGADTFYQVYHLLVGKASVLPYAVATGDGPWYRYLVDLLLVSPIIFLLACGAMFKLHVTDKQALFLVLFMAGSYLAMCNVRYGMNLRYANMWDMPLRYLAVLVVIDCVRSMRWRQEIALGGIVALLCAFDLRQYQIFFVQHSLYELVTGGLLHALQILK